MDNLILASLLQANPSLLQTNLSQLLAGMVGNSAKKAGDAALAEGLDKDKAANLAAIQALSEEARAHSQGSLDPWKSFSSKRKRRKKVPWLLMMPKARAPSRDRSTTCRAYAFPSLLTTPRRTVCQRPRHRPPCQLRPREAQTLRRACPQLPPPPPLPQQQQQLPPLPPPTTPHPDLLKNVAKQMVELKETLVH